MTRQLITVAVAAALFAATTVSAYTNATGINYAVDLDCTSCIRAGFDYCIYGQTDGKNPVGTNWNCSQSEVVPNSVLPADGKLSGYVCSSNLTDQMTAIIAGCRPAANNVNTGCGEYFINLNEGEYGLRQIAKMKVNTSCTYRAFSTCGYPSVQLLVRNSTIAGDFDIAYAAETGLTPDVDLGSTWNVTQVTDWNNSMRSNSTDLPEYISQGYYSPKLGDDEYNNCDAAPRNLWITITRTKVSSKQAQLNSEFLALTPRSLQTGNGTLFYDVELAFTKIQGGFAKALGAFSMALIAALSVFAF